jgi:hypothetical protein
MDWKVTSKNLKKLVGKDLESISGKSNIRVKAVEDEYVEVRAKTKAGKAKIVRRRTEELQKIVAKMDKGVPIHVDAEVKGSGSSRNQPETILANMPDVEWTKVDNRKHIVWVGKNTHSIGSLKRMS